MRKEGKYFLSNDEYHADKDYLSSSQIKVGHRDPLFYRHYIIDGNGEEKKDTEALIKGLFGHTFLLEPHELDNEFFIHDGELTKKGEIPKTKLKEYLHEFPTLKPVPRHYVEWAQRAKENIYNYDAAYDLMFKDEDGENEVSYFNKCKRTGERLRVRPDRLLLNRKIIVDLKTTRNASYEAFRRDALFKFHYDLSAYMYSDQIHQIENVLCEFIWVVVGTDEHAPIAVYPVGTKTLLSGQEKFVKGLKNMSYASQTKRPLFQRRPETI